MVLPYDSDHNAHWSWLLHCPNKISIVPGKNRLAVTGSPARSQIDFFASLPVNLDVHNRFDPPALNWRNKTSGGKTVQYPDQWHAAVSPVEKVRKVRYLSILQVLSENKGNTFATPDILDDHTFRVGSWSIAAELDPNRTAAIEIKSSDQKAVLAANKGSITIGAERYATTRSNTAILVEKLTDCEIVRESTDSCPIP